MQGFVHYASWCALHRKYMDGECAIFCMEISRNIREINIIYQVTSLQLFQKLQTEVQCEQRADRNVLAVRDSESIVWPNVTLQAKEGEGRYCPQIHMLFTESITIN